MSFFNRNPNESAYVGGKKHWADVIKNSGDGELMIWRQPEEDFNVNSTLIVQPGEVAVFVRDGIIQGVYDKGREHLDTNNFPFLSRITNAFTGGISTFHCVVYFVRTADSKEIKWGTNSPIQVRDKVHNIRTGVTARGAYKVRVAEPARFLEKMIGNNVPYETQEGLQSYFKSEFQSKIKTAVSGWLNKQEEELIGIDAYLETISQSIQPDISASLKEYGLECARFSLSAMDVDISKYDRLDDIIIYTKKRMTDVKIDTEEAEMQGGKYPEIQGAKALRDWAKNPNAGGMTGLVGFQAVGLTQTVPEKEPARSVKEAFQELNELRDMGVLTDEEYEEKRQKLVAKI